MGDFSIASFFEALFKYGKDYGLTLWHFLAFAVLGILLWVGSKVASGAGKAVQGAQSVYIKMIEDLQKKAEADRVDQEARVTMLREQLRQARGDLAEVQADLDVERTSKLAAQREASNLRLALVGLTSGKDVIPELPTLPTPAPPPAT